MTTGASLDREQSEHYAGDNLRTVTVRTRRLDALVAEHELRRPDLIKLDVQGAELDVLVGAGELLSGTSALIAEMSLLAHNQAAALIAGVIGGIDRPGFRCADVCDVLARRTAARRRPACCSSNRRCSRNIVPLRDWIEIVKGRRQTAGGGARGALHWPSGAVRLVRRQISRGLIDLNGSCP